MYGKNGNFGDVSDEELGRIVRYMSNVSDSDAVGSGHLNDDEYFEYASGDADEAQLLRVDAHLNNCDTCTEEIDTLISQMEVWDTDNERRKFARSKQRIGSFVLKPAQVESRESLFSGLETFLNSFSLKPALQFSSGDVTSTDSEDYLFATSVRYEDDDVHVTLSSFDMDMSDEVVEVIGRKDDGSEEVLGSDTLQRVSEPELSVDFTIAIDEMRLFSEINLRHSS